MEKAGLAGIGKFVMRNRQYLGCLRARAGALILEQLHFADEVDKPAKVAPAKSSSVGKRELDMAMSLIESLTTDWKPQKYRDTYHDALMEVIEAKQKGREVRPVAEPEQEEAPDLLEALRLSVESAGRRGAKSRGRRAARKSPTRAKAGSAGRTRR
jgi:DNA end-binding protein Ku